MNLARFETVVQSNWTLLERFYEAPAAINPKDYIRISQDEGSRVLLTEDPACDTLFMTAEFSASIIRQLESSNSMAPQTLGVVSEELSHLFHLVHAATSETQVSAFQLECRAEIDRFITFLHWNSFFPEHPLSVKPENCFDVCDLLFEARTFSTEQELMYREAESFAFFHLKRAFSHVWARRQLDTRTYDAVARNYIRHLCLPQRKLALSA